MTGAIYRRELRASTMAIFADCIEKLEPDNERWVPKEEIFKALSRLLSVNLGVTLRQINIGIEDTGIDYFLKKPVLMEERCTSKLWIRWG